MKEKSKQTYHIHLGKIAHKWLSNSSSLTITGITSAGVFLKTTQKQVLFFTTSEHLGPVNVIFDKDLPQSWKAGETVSLELTENSIFLNHASNNYELITQSFWEPPSKPAQNIDQETQLSRIRKSAKQLSILKNGAGFSPLLLPYLQKNRNPLLDSDWLNNMWQKILDLSTAIKSANKSQVLKIANEFIGAGRGLTPSGDDLLTGLVLMHNRFFSGANWFTDLYKPLIDQFNQKTTSVSSTLFYCATIGEADIRILRMADALVNQEIVLENQAFDLARWGNSSGADIFLGQIIAILCFQENTRD